MQQPLPQKMNGVVCRYKGNGRKLGYPTANIAAAAKLKDGVYFGYADLDSFKHHPALIFVGTPTTMGDTERRLEVHLLDIPDTDYYDQQLAVSLEHYHRPNRTFDGVEALRTVMRDDEAAGRQWFIDQSGA